MVTKTPNYGFELIALGKNPYTDSAHDNWRIVDAVFSKFIAISNIKGVWNNSLVIAVGEKYVDKEKANIWTALVAHTSAASGTFEADRSLNPTYWEKFSVDLSFAGAYAPNTAYLTNSFLSDSNRYGFVTTGYTSTTTYDIDVANGNIITLIDLTIPLATAEASAVTAQAETSAAMPKYTFSTTTTDADPGAGILRYNNATAASVTEIYIDNTTADAGNPDIAAWLLSWDDSTSTLASQIRLVEPGTPANYAVFNVTAAADGTGYVRLTVAHVDSNGTFADTDSIRISNSRTGDKGETGNTGATGPIGATGPQGSVTLGQLLALGG